MLRQYKRHQQKKEKMVGVQESGLKHNASCEDDSSTGLLHLEEQSLPPETNRKIEVRKIEVNSFTDLNRYAAYDVSMKNRSAGVAGSIRP